MVMLCIWEDIQGCGYDVSHEIEVYMLIPVTSE